MPPVTIECEIIDSAYPLVTETPVTKKFAINISPYAIGIRPEGYGDRTSYDGEGWPIYIEAYADDVKVVIFDDINKEDPQIISLNGAKESLRRDVLEDTQLMSQVQRGEDA